ncbi:hypothetical protein [Nostoc sp. DedSLP04]|nr:hypothetical protein [Nostoc sp. DedSLP04]
MTGQILAGNEPLKFLCSLAIAFSTGGFVHILIAINKNCQN